MFFCRKSTDLNDSEHCSPWTLWLYMIRGWYTFLILQIQILECLEKHKDENSNVPPVKLLIRDKVCHKSFIVPRFLNISTSENEDKLSGEEREDYWVMPYTFFVWIFLCKFKYMPLALIVTLFFLFRVIKTRPTYPSWWMPLKEAREAQRLVCMRKINSLRSSLMLGEKQWRKLTSNRYLKTCFQELCGDSSCILVSHQVFLALVWTFLLCMKYILLILIAKLTMDLYLRLIWVRPWP